MALQACADGAPIAARQRVLAVAAYAGPEVAAASSAPIVPRALGKVMQDRGFYAAAQSLLAQADEYERAPAPAEPPKSARPEAPRGESHAG